MEECLQRIKRKITEAGHSLGPVLTEQGVVAFERRHRVRLPEGYRRFLMEVGNGGDGPPHYGLACLEGPAEDLSEEGRARSRLKQLDQDFPFTGAWIWEGEEGMWDASGADWTEEGKAKLARTERGNLYLGTDGCAQYWHLIVTGPERGNVWLFADVGITPTVPRRDFLRWYEDWLDGVENWLEP